MRTWVQFPTPKKKHIKQWKNYMLGKDRVITINTHLLHARHWSKHCMSNTYYTPYVFRGTEGLSTSHSYHLGSSRINQESGSWTLFLFTWKLILPDKNKQNVLLKKGLVPWKKYKRLWLIDASASTGDGECMPHHTCGGQVEEVSAPPLPGSQGWNSGHQTTSTTSWWAILPNKRLVTFFKIEISVFINYIYDNLSGNMHRKISM